MQGHQIDGNLAEWDDIADLVVWETLLLGNGFSINLWGGFEYSSLYDQAARGSAHDTLSDADRCLFEELDTRNFELVLGQIRSAIRMAESLKQDPAPYYERYRSIQAALGNAVRSAHIKRGQTSKGALDIIRSELSSFKCIFSTCYDLMTYWAMGHGDDGYKGFCDCFWANGNRQEFDPENAHVQPASTPVYFMHGALHLVVQGTGVTRKLTNSDQTLLEQFGKPIEDDPKARPLLITEGSSHDKLRAIDGNDYLKHCLERLRHRSDPLVVFGHALGPQDRHLVDAINENPDRPVALSIRPGDRGSVMKRQAHFRGVLHTERLYFFDAETHGLGDPRLTKKGRRTGMFHGQ